MGCGGCGRGWEENSAYWRAAGVVCLMDIFRRYHGFSPPAPPSAPGRLQHVHVPKTPRDELEAVTEDHGSTKEWNICRILGLEATGAIFRGVGILSIGGRGTIKGWGKGVTTSMPLNISLFTLVAVSFLVLLERPGLVSAFGYGGNNSLLVNIFWLKDSAKKGDGGDGVGRSGQAFG